MFLSSTVAPAWRRATSRLLAARRPGYLLLLLLALLGLSPTAHALQGNDNCHDPSSIVKDGNKYWIFTTGTGIYGMYSTDLVKLESGPRPVFAAGAYPS